MKKWVWGALTGVVACAAAVTWALDSDGMIDVEKFFGGDGLKGYSAPRASTRNIEDLRQRVLGDMVYIPGGSFKLGNVPVPVMLDGEVRNELIYGPVVDADRAPISIGSYYISRFEVTNYDFDLYAAANDLSLRPDVPNGHERQGPYPANIAYHQATGFCEWLSEITGHPFNLPTQEQWEYAARSGGHDVAYATQDGTYDYLAKLYHETLNDQPHTSHLPDAYPPNPIGLYAMSSNLSEWVLESWADPESGAVFENGFEGDPALRHRRVWRGSYHGAQASLNSLFMYGAAGQLHREDMLQYFPSKAPYFEPDLDVIYDGFSVGARCVVNIADAPDKSGFGRPPGAIPDDFPKAFEPLKRR
ncbi:SUMF1/EgtB/PvdO family nonheme iron enzyme [uncultured Litoreibacter sp.]|uniref:formylglycine-generating enzyme family protein n=1 Tax=uncultured Litoreibacter sp. TaxID=1392394 RepID=UPI00261057D0|nr:SUMF1/EgtB/PvdO family nonheme iron enzyme [uncultured Litoreibacter sp.]